MKTNEFVVKSMNHCFICLNQITSHSEHGPESDLKSIYSIHSLSRYLKMDMGTVFSENELVPQHLLDKVRKSKLKGEMCLECALLNETISERYKILVKIELELISSIKKLQSKLLAANEAEKSTKLRQLADSLVDSKDGWRGKLDILEVLRAEAVQKCSRKLHADTPRVKVPNLTTDQVMNEKLKLQSNSLRDAQSHVKIQTDLSFGEPPDPNIGSGVSGRVNPESPLMDSIPDGDGLDWENTQSTANSDKLETSSHSSDTSTSRRNVKSKSGTKTYDKQGYSFVVVIPPSSSKIPKPQPTFNTNTKKYKCNLCPSERKNMALFKIHYESSHLNVRYKCDICGKEFSQQSQYKLHHRTIHLGYRFKCLGCNKIFTQKSSLMAHQRRKSCHKTVPKTEMV